MKKIIDGVEVEEEETNDEPIEDEKELWLQSDEEEEEETSDEEDDETSDEEEEETSDEEDDETSDDNKKAKKLPDDKKVSVRKHIHMKQKLKRRAFEKEKENEALKEENERLKEQLRKTTPVKTEKLVRPHPDDFDDDNEYAEALRQYEQDLVDQRIAQRDEENSKNAAIEEYKRQRDQAVDEHYDRAAKLVEDSKIDPDAYKAVEDKVYAAVEEIIPKMGDATIGHLISLMGEGSEKVLYYIGRNKKVLDEFKTSLKEDSTGLAVTLFLGRLHERITGSKNKVSRAKKPAPKLDGDKGSSKGEKLYHRKYKAAHEKKDFQLAFNIKREAKSKGVDTSKW